MFRSKSSWLSIVASLVVFMFAVCFTGCGGSSKPMSVGVTAAASTVDGADTTTLTATVANDKNAQGVKWTASAGTLSSSTTTSATLTAPAATSAQQTITVTAASIADSTKSGTATITVAAVPAITSLTAAQQSVGVGTAYSATLAGTGGITPYKSWALATGSSSLPPCLSLSSSGTLSSPSTPTAACVGVYSGIKFAMTDSGIPTALTATSSAQTITVTGPAIVFPTSLASGQVGTAYAGSVAATGALGTTTYSLASGALPPDLTLNTSTGAITGTPKAADVGTASFKVTVVDAFADTTTSGTLSITIAAAPAITFSGAPAATATFGVAYASSVTAAGGAGALTYGLASGTPPPDLALGANGAIAGTPKTADIGTFAFAVKATDTFGDSATSGNYSIVVSFPAVTLTPAAGSLPLAVTGQAYSQTLTATGGSGTGYTWTVTGLPANGLTYVASGATLTISGPANATGTVSLTASVKDDAANSAGPFAYTIQIFSPVTLPTSPATLPSTATVDVAYTGTMIATGGSGNYTWTVAGLSDGLSSSTSGATLTIAGTPSSAATVTLTASVKDTTTNVTAGPLSYTINVYASVTLPTTNPSTLGPATVNSAYIGTIVAAGGTGNYTWTVTGLPSDNLNYATNGNTLTISGTPGTATTVSFTAKVTDTTMNVSSGPYTYTVTVYDGVTLPSPNPATLSPADAGTAYSGTIVAAGGSGNYAWTVTGMPADGLNYSTNGATLTISGTPASAQSVQFTAKVTDITSNQSAGPLTYSIAVSGPLSLPTPDPNSLPSNGYTNASYSGFINAAGGSGSYSWSVSGLSDGLSVIGGTTGSTLTIGGTPTAPTSGGNPVTVTFSVTLTDTATNASITQSGYNITISYPTPVSLPSPNPTSLPSATVNRPYNGAINAMGGVPPYTWSINGNTIGSAGYSLGNGTLVASSTGGNTLSVYGTPSSTGTVTLTGVQVTDSLNTMATAQTYTINVSPVSTVSVTVNQIPQGTVNMPYTFGDLSISGGNGPYTVAYTNAPAGLALQSGTWSLVGTPTASGSPTVTLKVTDSTTPTPQTATTTFTLTIVPETTGNNNSELDGQYACYYQQYWDNGTTGGSGATLYRDGLVFALKTDGGGHITGGEADSNSAMSGFSSAASNGALGGTYAVGSDNRGYILLTAGGSSVATFAVAGGSVDSNSHFSEFSIVSMNDAGSNPDGKHGNGHCFEQNTVNLSGIQASGGLVWAMSGEDDGGNVEIQVGSGQYSAGTISGMVDMARAGTYEGSFAISGTDTTTDAYGRMTVTAGPTPQTANLSVWYITNNAAGEGVGMTANPHNAANASDFMIGESRAQNAAHIASAYPVSGRSVLYATGLSSAGSYDSIVSQSVGSSTAATITLNANFENAGGTITNHCAAGSPCSSSYTYSPATGRLTINGQSGVAMYLYDTDSAAVFMANGSSTTSTLSGWLQPQTAPTSGTWVIGDLATSFFLSTLPNGDSTKNLSSGVFTVNSSGAFTNFVQDDGGDNWADWDEGPSGESGGTATGVVVPDITYDPNGTFGIFDINITAGGTTQTQVYCVAVSVDNATNSNTRARLVCFDASTSPRLTIVQE